MKYQSGWSRYILRKAMEDLPKEVRWRFFKQDYLPPLQQNMFSEEKFLDEVVHSKILEDYVDPDKLKKVYNNFKSQYEREGRSGPIEDVTNSIDVWLVTILYAWLREKLIKCSKIDNLEMIN